MQKLITVKRFHRYEHTRDIIYRGECEYHKQNDCIILRYWENNKEAKTHCEIIAAADHMEIRREGETASTLYFEVDKQSKGVLTTPYGNIEIGIYTYRYIRRENVITLEYDLMENDRPFSGYQMLWNIKEGSK